MGWLAQRLVRWRWAVVAVWLAVAVFALLRAPGTQDRLSIRGGSTAVTEAQEAERLLAARFARPVADFFAVTVAAPVPFTEARPRELLDSLTRAFGRQPFVTRALSFTTTGDSAFLSKDRRSTFVLLALDAPTGDSAGKLVWPARRVARAVLATFPEGVGYRTHVTGRSALDLDIKAASAQDSRDSEVKLLPLTLVVLVLAFGALVAAVLPLVIGFLAIAVTLTIVGYLAELTPMSIFVLNMTTMIGLGVGIDYSLLVVTRFREELSRGARRVDAAIRTIETAGVAVFTSGLTVMVGFGALLFTPLIETRSVGIGGLVVVAVAVVLAVTLLPALLAFLGRGIDHPRWLARRLAWYHAPQVWERWARSLARHPRRAMILGGITVAALTAPVFLIRIGLPARHWWPTRTEAGAGVEALTQMGAGGIISPMRVLVEVPDGESAVSALRLRGLKALSDSLKADPRVVQVRSVVDVQPDASILGLSLYYSDLDSARARNPAFLDAYLSRDGRVALLDVILRDTTSLTTAMDVVARARELALMPVRGLKDTRTRVGGYVASAVDFQRDLLGRFPLMVGLILLTTAVMLAVAFRSVLVPLKAVVMNTLSVSATFGVIVLVFQYGIGGKAFGIAGPTEAIFVVVPVLVFAVVFGLSMDYEVFLLARIKEAFDRTGDNQSATMEGLSATASVITSAALIMIMVFGVFAFAQVLVMQFLGFGLAVAVLLDATVIRMVLVPAFMHLMGRWNWWPGVRGDGAAVAETGSAGAASSP